MDAPGAGTPPDAAGPSPPAPLAAPAPASPASSPAAPAAALPARFENGLFFGDALRQGGPVAIPESVFYGSPRPPPEVSLATRTALTPVRFAFILFLVGWAGILLQNNFLQQVVFGAPVFEELAKLGLALIPVALLRINNVWVRLALAWASGVGFGVFEHYSTYAEEDLALHVGRALFHGASAGLSMAFYHAFDDMGDVRTRWASTAVSTLLHWANNFGAIVFAFGTLALPFLDVVALAWASVVTATLLLLNLVVVLWNRRFVERSRRALWLIVPRLGLGAAPGTGTTTLPPPPVREPPAQPPPPGP